MSPFERGDSENQRGETPGGSLVGGMVSRLLQGLVRRMPGGFSFRVWAHRMRGVTLGTGVHISAGVMIETRHPQRVSIGNNVQLGTRCMILADKPTLSPRNSSPKNAVSVRIDDDVYIGPGAIILPYVRVGRGAVVTAGSVVSRSVAPKTMVQGNPAQPVARCGVSLTRDTPLKTFYLNLKPLERRDLSVYLIDSSSSAAEG